MSVPPPSSATFSAHIADRLPRSGQRENGWGEDTGSDTGFQHVRFEIAAWLEAVSGLARDAPENQDRVFDGMVRDFEATYEALKIISRAIVRFIEGVDYMCDAMGELAEAFVIALGKKAERTVASDCCKYKQAVSTMTVSDAPHSIVAKLKRDLNFNLTAPLQAHFNHYKKLREQLVLRTRRLHEYLYARKCLQARCEAERSSDTPSDPGVAQAEAKLKQSLSSFYEIDRPLFEWLYMLEEYKNDIYDSLLQTVKYLQYEFFAGCAHTVAHVLPKRMEFRPLVEMTPDQLEPQVQMELDEYLQRLESTNGLDIKDDATAKIIDRWERAPSMNKGSNTRPETESQGEPRCTHVDPLCLSVLTLQGFDAEAARTALRYHNNDTQSALDCLLEQHQHLNPVAEEQHKLAHDVLTSVRLPSTLKWVRKLKGWRQSTTETAKPLDQRECSEKPTIQNKKGRNQHQKEEENLLILSPKILSPKLPTTIHTNVSLLDIDSAAQNSFALPSEPAPAVQPEHSSVNLLDGNSSDVDAVESSRHRFTGAIQLESLLCEAVRHRKTSGSVVSNGTSSSGEHLPCETKHLQLSM